MIELNCAHEILTPEKETELAETICNARSSYDLLVKKRITVDNYNHLQDTVKRARDTLAYCNRRLVAQIATRYKPRPPISYDDLISEGNLALLAAIEKFDPRLSRFTTYASFHVNRAIISYLNSQTSMITIPAYLIEESSEVYKAIRFLEIELEREPLVPEIAVYTSKCEQRIKIILAAIQCRYIHMTSLDANEDCPLTFEDTRTLEPSEIVATRIRNKSITEHIKLNLTEREALVIKLYFGFDNGEKRTLKEVGDILGLTKERIRQIINESKEKIHGILSNEL